MEQHAVPATPVTVSATIRQPMNDHGTVTVELGETNETRYLVEYDSDRFRQVLRTLPTGTTLPIQMTRVGSRSNVWRVAGLPGVPNAVPRRV
ncbi:hypothetical protein [Salinigranum halophilum]|uniref:hypothetical protein n=1 Tax=Salinigranum halophilum TaxID=2565931 RepID=UPI0010A94128|nr:hypothetical protein [Salinigranum halophilum]